MATQLDQKIEQLENIVERHMDPCKVTCNGSHCILPRNHARTEPHQFLVDFLEMLGAAERFHAGVDHSLKSDPAQTPGSATPRRRWGDNRTS
jgi:hypothetical protein